ncbi:hypothetical protein KJ662_05665 [Patescibacteria group bacterium]|nr:hypothetical protein [Patescibacteria group bacterium]
MLGVADVYQLFLDELRVDKRGLSVEPDEFNRILRLVNQEIYDQYITDFETDIKNVDSLGWFKVHNYGITLTAGVGTMPANYYQVIGKPRILDGATTRMVDIVAEFEYGARQEDFLTQATVTHPYCRIGGVNATGELQVRVTPTTITEIRVDYLKSLTVPFLDYMVKNDTYVSTFFADTAVAQSVPLGYTYRDGTAGGAAVTITSLTEDMVWDDGDLSLIITKLVNRAAKQLPDELLLQTSMAEQTKSEE